MVEPLTARVVGGLVLIASVHRQLEAGTSRFYKEVVTWLKVSTLTTTRTP